MAVYRQLTITFQENGDVDYRFFRSSANSNLTRYLIAYPAERVSVTGGENLAGDNFRSSITREGHVLLTWERGPGGKRGIHYSKIGFLEVVQQEPLLLRYREKIHIKNERQIARHGLPGASLTRDAIPLSRDAKGAIPLSRDAEGATPLSRDAEGATPLSRDAEGATPLSRDAEGATPLSRDAKGATPLSWDVSSATPLTWDTSGMRRRGSDQPNLFLLKVHDRNQRLSAVENRSEAVFHCTSPGTIHTCQAFLRRSHGTSRLVCSEHQVEAGQRLALRPTELVGAQFLCAGVLAIDWILEVLP